MNGSESFRRPQLVDPRSLYEAPGELSDSEKMDLMAGDDAPYARAIDKLMKLEIVKARNEAMDADPANEKAQATKMTVAHAMNKFYESLRSQINLEKTSHVADVKLRIAEEQMQDHKVIEEIIFKNATGAV